MRALVPIRVWIVWLLLMGATMLSWQLGADHGAGAAGPRAAMIAVLGVALVKVRLIGLHFMELRDAPLTLRLLFEGYVVIVCALLIGLYLAA